MIYLASPFFNEAQVNVIENLKGIMEDLKLSYYSPKDEMRLDFKKDPPEKIKQCFDANCNSVKTSELILAVIDDFDPGTVWEIGYGYSFKKSVIAYSNVPGRGLNLMLAQSCERFCNGLPEISEVLREYKETHKICPTNWVGHIE